MKSYQKLAKGGAIAALGLLLANCAPQNYAQRDAAIGAAGGAIAGAMVGNNVGDGNATRGAVIGAMLGGLGGAAVGNNKDQYVAPRPAPQPAGHYPTY